MSFECPIIIHHKDKTLFIARTLKLYDVPLVRFVKVWLTALDAVTQVTPLLLDTWKCVIRLPPLLDGAAQLSMTRPLPGVAVRFLGINDAVARLYCKYIVFLYDLLKVCKEAEKSKNRNCFYRDFAQL